MGDFMKKMKMLIGLLTSILLLLCACSDSSGFNDALSDTIANLDVSTVQSDANSEIDEVEADDIPEQAHQAEGYGVYSSLIYAYEKALTIPGTEESNGTLYAKLIDFNNDGVLELVIARVFNGEYGEYREDEHLDESNEAFIGGDDNPTVMIYTIGEDGGAQFIDEFNLSYFGEEGIQFNIEYATVGDKTYLVTGGDMNGVLERTFWEYNDVYFSIVKSFETYYEYDNAGYVPTNYYINFDEVSQGDFEHELQMLYSNSEFHTIVGVGYPTHYEEVTNETKAFLADYPRGNSVGRSAVFHNGSFVIIEEHAQTYEQIAVVDYEKAKVLQSYDELVRVTGSEESAESIIEMYEAGSYLPGTILETLDVDYLENAGIESIDLANSISQSPDLSQLQNPNIISVKRQSVIDMDVVQYQGQYGQAHRQWFVVHQVSDMDIKIASFYDSNHMMMPDDLYEVLFVGYSQEIFDAFGYEIPDFLSLTDEQQNSIEFFSTEGGNEYYLIVNSWNAPIKIYENLQGDVRGELLYETTSSVLYILCNVSELQSDVELVSAPYGTDEFSYYPMISLKDGTELLGDYATYLR